MLKYWSNGHILDRHTHTHTATVYLDKQFNCALSCPDVHYLTVVPLPETFFSFANKAAVEEKKILKKKNSTIYARLEQEGERERERERNLNFILLISIPKFGGSVVAITPSLQ